MLHRIWQRTGKYPTEILSQPRGVQAFIWASEMKAIEEEAERPPAIRL